MSARGRSVTIGSDLQSICDTGGGAARVRGMAGIRCSVERPMGRLGGHISMLHPVSRMPRSGAIEPPVSERRDRSMDVLQYAMAFLAIIVAALLASVR
jgi:hypothetical protein